MFGLEKIAHRNFMNLGFPLIIVIKKDLFQSFGKHNIKVLEEQLYQIFRSHKEFVEPGMKVGISLLPKEDFPYKAQIRFWKSPKTKKCHLNINANAYADKPRIFYPVLVHELTHWHDREVAHRWLKSCQVSDVEEVNLISMVLHSLRIDGLTNLKEFYAKATEHELFDMMPHKITQIAGQMHVNLDYVYYVRDFKVRLANFKRYLPKSKEPKNAIVRWAAAQYTHFYFLGGMMCYFILFMHMIQNGQENLIHVHLGENVKKRIDIRKIKHFLHRKDIYFGKVPLSAFEYTYNEIRRLRPAEFFILYLEACKALGLNYEGLLLFDKPDIELIMGHRQDIDKEL